MSPFTCSGPLSGLTSSPQARAANKPKLAAGPVLPTSDTAAKDFRKQKRHTDWAKKQLEKGIKQTLNAFDDHRLPTCEARYRANEIR